jgi:serine/threonine protein phosphatase PrpC
MDAVEASAPDGNLVILVFGEAFALEREAHALRTVGARIVVPEVVGIEHDDAHGAFLVLRDPGRHSALFAIRPQQEQELESEDVARVHGALRAVLEIARAMEKSGFAWSPEPEDLALDGVGVSVQRLRGATRLGPRERLDARSVFEAFGTALVPTVPGLPLGLLRLLLRRNVDGLRTIEAMESEIAAAAEVLVAREDDAALAFCSDVGLLREHNEDTARVTIAGDVAIAVVCDGVSASRDAHLAADIASRTATSVLVDKRDESAVETMDDALRAAHEAICDAHQRRGGDPLGTTIVAARVQGRRVTIGWVGDSRAYFIAPDDARLLTHDHSWLNEALAAGAAPDEAVRSPFAHALTRCLGPLEGGDAWHAEPEVVDVQLDRPGYVILCSDGLWNYASSAEEVAELATPCLSNGAGAIARALTAAALARGGQDNITVAVIKVT